MAGQRRGLPSDGSVCQSHRYGRRRAAALTLIEVLVLLFMIGLLIALLLPAVNSNREPARRLTCTNQVKMIGLALHNYAQVNRRFPAGTICTTKPMEPANQYDVWEEASKKEKGFQGTSFLLAIMPYMEFDAVYRQWDFDHGIAYNAENGSKVAMCELISLYCPTRRSRFRAEVDDVMMLDKSWTGGGTDYGGCAGRHAAFTLETGYNLCDASMFYEPGYLPSKFPDKADDPEEKRWGIFGRVNVGTTFDEITDGVSNTIMIGELQRITDAKPMSKDGWAIGGPATLFTTGAMMQFDFDGKTCRNVDSPEQGTLMNNHFFGSPGSDHAGTVNVGLGDGSVRSLSVSMDPNTFSLLGSMADGERITPEY